MMEPETLVTRHSSLVTSPGVRAIVQLALAEDIGRGDLTTEATVAPDATATAEIIQKAPGVLCGLPVVALVFAELDPAVRLTPLAEEGSWGERRVVARLEGPARALLTGERTALNFLQRLSGVATASRRAAGLVEGTGATVLDTRKTTPGQRVLEKYAVRVGGCHNHRAGLDDGILIKDNHIRAAGGITAAVTAARRRTAPMQLVEVEVTNLAELDEAIAAGADVILLDNCDEDGLRAAVARAAGRVRLEASGGVTLANLAAVARTGVDYVSLGALTHSAGSLDFSLEVV
ncbi:MAG TPA: carboxylating nicotinate-nucleotide diphosphorylase [Thermomicrobiales bacterium]|nr:carboxylating nicotinate-nucleotide diphosphorylase [Thermomicrobiales bacterium]